MELFTRFSRSVIAATAGSALMALAEEPLPTDYGDPANDIVSGSVAGLTWQGAARSYKIGEEVVLVFTNTAANACSFEIAPHYVVNGRYLLVAGGGAGGYTGEYQLIGAGGGAGGMLEGENANFAAGHYVVTVGAGGEPKGHKDWGTDENPNNNGTDSVLLNGSDELFRAIGGGAGGIPNGNWKGNLATGRAGGSGGGSATMNGYAQSRGQGTEKQGNTGGKSVNNSYSAAGGGGGAGAGGATASDGTHSGAGGAGKSSSITGEDVWYAGGGAGGAYAWYTKADIAGGLGGGGLASARTDDADAIVYRSDNGMDGLGGGGAGASGGNGATGLQFTKAGRGGNGVVVVRLSIEEEIPLDGVSFSGEASWHNIGSGKTRETVIVYTNVNEVGTLTLGRRATANILLVGGGGAGGNSGESKTCCAGGGAGGFVETNALQLVRGAYSITVGRGGLPNKDCNTRGLSGNGNPSLLVGAKVSLTAFGGGAGGIANGALGSDHAQGRGGAEIGSGGGGAYYAGNGQNGKGGIVDGTQGCNGGSHLVEGNFNDKIRAGSGGGGAGGQGADATIAQTGGAGGVGKMSTISGQEVWYAGGGAGGGYYWTVGDRIAEGGKGGGGSSIIKITKDTIAVSEQGVDGLGGGGAGSCGAEGNGKNPIGTAGRGGNGVVIVRITEVAPAGLIMLFR